MKNFSEMRHIAKASSEAGLEPKETRKIIDGSLFSESDLGLLGMLKSSLKDGERRAMLLNVLESRDKKPVPLGEIINVLDRFSVLKDKLEHNLTESDIKLLNFTIKYFEDWFYRGKWAKIPKNQKGKPNTHSYFSVPAGIVNMVTKIKEIPEYSGELTNFDSDKLIKLQAGTRNFMNQFLSEDNLQSILNKKDKTAYEIDAINTIRQNRSKIMEVFNESERSVKNEFADRGSGSKAPDLYFLKTCLIAAEVLEREKVKGPNHVFIPDIEILKEASNYLMFDFSNGQNPRNNSMHYHKARLAYCKFVVEYLRRLNR